MAQYDHLNGQGNTPYGGASYSPSPYASQDRLGPTSSPYASGDPYYNESTGYITPQPAKKGTSNWIKIGIPVAILVIAAAVVGGILGTRHKSAQAATSGVAAASAAKKVGLFATATNSEFMMPIYPSATNAAAYSSPTFNSPSGSLQGWPSDSFQPSNPSPTSVRSDRPRLIAPAYKWQALPALIAQDPYLQSWNATIFGNASDYYSQPPVVYFMDGDSGILDNSRAVKERVKAFSYAYRMTNDTKWVDRTFTELQNAAGNGSTPFGPANNTKWNPAHFLDTAEMTAAFAIGYDWLYDVWTADQKSQIMSSMITYGLDLGVTAFGADPTFTGWWKNATEGNWNCVCNSGLTLGALAILGDDNSGTASQLLGLTVDNAKQNCALAVSSDGSWSETANYWYFGTTGHAEMSAALNSATGSDYGLISTNPTFNLTGLFHMYITGPTSLFNYGDHGPNKYSTTANSMLYYADQYNIPRYALFQRDQRDAPEPWSMFWYNPTISGAFWDQQPLDHFFEDSLDQWGSMRSSWTDMDALYVAMKAGKLQGHQTHNDLDCGDFVLDAMGTRWAGELGSGDYRSTGYFSSDAQDSVRWLYYRKRTEGQNAIIVAGQNQVVTAAPTIQYGTTGESQGSPTVYTVPGNSAAYFTADISSAYGNVTSYKRGIRTINGRKQVLLQDEINASQQIMWRMHTNATVSIDSGGTSATLTLDGQTMKMQLLNPPSGAQISTMPATRLSTDPPTPDGYPDQDNPGVTVVTITLNAGQYDLQMLFNPQWSGMSASDFKTPSFVAIDSWSTTSHP